MEHSTRKKRKAVFLDRDGVITQQPPHYAHRRDQLKLILGAAQAIRMLNDHGFLVIVITNQAGIGHGFYEEKDMHMFNGAMKEELKKESGAEVYAIYWCPHHPEAVQKHYKFVCDCRKPNAKLFFCAEQDFSINLEQSFMVGDTWSDIAAGKKAGCKTIMVRTGYGEREIAEPQNRSADYYAADIFEAAHVILETQNV